MVVVVEVSAAAVVAVVVVFVYYYYYYYYYVIVVAIITTRNRNVTLKPVKKFLAFSRNTTFRHIPLFVPMLKSVNKILLPVLASLKRFVSFRFPN
jgi:hypothetical protein